MDTTPSTWTQERIELIKRTICPAGISTDEFLLFVEQCKRTGLDPLLKEAFCVPRRQNVGSRERPQWVARHEFQPSETGMLARAERFPDFGGVQASAVYGGDEILIDAGRGEVVHRFNPCKRTGALVGAWARVVRAGKLPVVVWLSFEGYAQATSLWAKIPTTMLEKCARVAVLRKAYPEAFGGLYIREEMEESTTPTAVEPRALPATTAPAGEVVAAPAVAVKRKPEPQAVEAMSDGELAVEIPRLEEWLRTHPRSKHTPGAIARLATAQQVERQRAAARRAAGENDVPF